MDEDTPIGSEITTLLGELNRTVDQRVRKLEKAVARQAPRDGFLPDDVSPGRDLRRPRLGDDHVRPLREPLPSSMNADREKLDEYWERPGGTRAARPETTQRVETGRSVPRHLIPPRDPMVARPRLNSNPSPAVSGTR